MSRTPAARDPGLPPTVLVFDSGLGGLTVLAELAGPLAGAHFIYAADTAGFPYGAWDEAALVERVALVVGRLVARHRPDLVVVACNTASTIALPTLRARLDVPVVGTVPAIKPAAARTRTGRIAVLATPGTVRREYTRALIEAYAGGIDVELVGSKRLAGLAEAVLRGQGVDEAAVRAEIAPCFVDRDGRRTDTVVLACTHFPLLLPWLRRLAPWDVQWIDPAGAIARQAAHLLGAVPSPSATPVPNEGLQGTAVFTDVAPVPEALRVALEARGLGRIVPEPMPLHAQEHGLTTRH